MKLTMWLKERELNARRLAAGRTGADRAGWLEDADHFQAALAAVDERERLRDAIEAALSAQRDAEALEMSHSEVIERLQAAISTMAKAKPLLYRCAPAAEFSAFCDALDSARGLLKA